MEDWRRRHDTNYFRSVAGNRFVEKYWADRFDKVAVGDIDTWDYQWMYCMFSRQGLSAVPSINLVSNIGFTDAATHTSAVDRRYVVPSRKIKFPLIHPIVVSACEEADLFERRYLYRPLRSAILSQIYRAVRPVTGPLKPLLDRIGILAPLRAFMAKLGI